MSIEIKDPLIRGIIVLVGVSVFVLVAMLAIEIYFSIVEGKLILTGVTDASKIFGYIIGGIFALG